jgi:hypothetical protein
VTRGVRAAALLVDYGGVVLGPALEALAEQDRIRPEAVGLTRSLS